MAKRKHIDYALVEAVRPPIYSAMKYWGKKPHNIWAEFIETYCPKNGIVLDPFAGSAISAFEAARKGRKVIAFDLNPLTSFMIESLTSEFDESIFRNAVEDIEAALLADEVYINHYKKVYKKSECEIYNYRWLDGKVVNLAIETSTGERLLIKANSNDTKNAKEMKSLDIPYWYPKSQFHELLSVSHKFIDDIGGNGYQYLWTRRNLYLLAKIFDEIMQLENQDLKLQLLSGFIQTLHLVSKMVVYRSPKSNRDFSGSWGRADYMIRRKSMEQNPLIVFKRSCLEKQGVVAALMDAKNTYSSKIKIADITQSKKVKKTTDINYGVVDIADLASYLPPKSVDFIITDPPYAGLVPYLDLSLVWLVWLEKLDKKYVPDLYSEITIKKGKVSREEYRRKLNNAFKKLHRVLKDDGYIVITFHHKKIQEWNDFVNAVRLAGFKFDKVTHQYNRRSGESNVSNPYGTSGADFYIRCVKHRDVDFSDDASGLSHFITQKTIEIIGLRNEPTPYTFLVSGLVPEMLQAGYMQPKEYQDELERILSENEGVGKIFVRTKNQDNKAGDYWWFNNPEEFINHPDLPLQDRMEQTIVSILRRKVSVKLDDVLGVLFERFPNGLTPDPRNIRTVLEKYAYKSSSFWKINPSTISSATEHTAVIYSLHKIATKAKYQTYVGKREQPESTDDGTLLRDIASHKNLKPIQHKYDKMQIKRIEMIDMVWLSNKSDIVCVFEVENSTGFMSAMQRASNIEAKTPKFMVIPDSREKELKEISDPLFISSFKKHNWSYITYSLIRKLVEYSKPSLGDLNKIAKRL